jgi:hypothetical protein
MQAACVIALSVAVCAWSYASAYQIGPVGAKLEARLTNETESSLIQAARRLGRVLKYPVHEEITQIGFDCPVDLANLQDDAACSSSDSGFATPFVIYGVRWNDMPPFRLNPGQGAKCKRYGIVGPPACNAEQTIRFSTQPDCWLCLFLEAEKIAQTKRITSCEQGDAFVQGTLMTRSHFGDLQFLHSMANTEGIAADVTQGKILDWVQFAWRVFDGDFGPETILKQVDIPTIREHFGCSNWTVSDIYVLGAKDVLNRRLPDIAFGSVVHTVQDSFAAGHVERELPALNEYCKEPPIPKPGPIVEFHAYAQQDPRKHDLQDSRDALVAVASGHGGAIDVTKQLFEYWNSNAKWKDIRPFFECVFELSKDHRPSSAGDDFSRN